MVIYSEIAIHDAFGRTLHAPIELLRPLLKHVCLLLSFAYEPIVITYHAPIPYLEIRCNIVIWGSIKVHLPDITSPGAPIRSLA